MSVARAVILMAAAFSVATPSTAHHSDAIFEPERTVALSGKVREFQWTNPHCWIQLTVAAAAGGEEWSVEMGAPLQLYQGGWKPGTSRSHMAARPSAPSTVGATSAVVAWASDRVPAPSPPGPIF